jgi:D-3-phosphoglycerate dehydrogenase
MLKRIIYVKALAGAEYAEIVTGRPHIALERLPDNPTDEYAGKLLADAHVYQITSARGDIDPAYLITGALLSRAQNLLAVSTNGVGYDTVDVAACTNAGVLVVNQAGGNKDAVAEHALGMMICLAKRIIDADRYMRRHSGIRRNEFMGRDLFGKTLGIIGFGAIGRELAELCRMFRMRIVVYDPYLASNEVTALGAEKVELDELLNSSDFVSVHCPLTSETQGLIGRREFGLVRPGAYFINTARGGIHDEDALAEALERRLIAGAGLDVWDEEPPPSDHPLLKFDSVLASPHTAGVTYEARSRVAAMAAYQVLSILDGTPPERLLNPEAWPKFEARFKRILGTEPST